ncbi:hypothetical protein CF326_g969 [Tilletia indica]|nr:hypothetical protein CF326_g969 [Tilletia indica]
MREWRLKLKRIRASSASARRSLDLASRLLQKNETLVDRLASRLEKADELPTSRQRSNASKAGQTVEKSASSGGVASGKDPNSKVNRSMAMWDALYGMPNGPTKTTPSDVSTEAPSTSATGDGGKGKGRATGEITDEDGFDWRTIVDFASRPNPRLPVLCQKPALRASAASRANDKAIKSPARVTWADTHDNGPLFTWPLGGGPGAKSLFRSDVSLLEHGEPLTVALIEFGLAHMFDQKRDEGEAGRKLADAIEVYSPIVKTRNGRLQLPIGDSDIFGKDYIIVPLSNDRRWSVAIIVHPALVLKLKSQQQSHEQSNPTQRSQRHNFRLPDSDDENEDQGTSKSTPTLKRKRVTFVEEITDSGDSSSSLSSAPELLPAPKRGRTLNGTARQSGRQPERAAPLQSQKVISLVEASDEESGPVVGKSEGSQAEKNSVQDGNKGGFDPNIPTIIFFGSKSDWPRASRVSLSRHLQFKAMSKRRTQLEDLGLTWDGRGPQSRKEAAEQLVDCNLIDAIVPEPPNWCDAGVYLLHYVRSFFSDPRHFEELIVNQFKEGVLYRQSHVKEEWRAAEGSTQRQFWQDIIKQRAKEWEEEQRQIRAEKEMRKDKERLAEFAGMDGVEGAYAVGPSTRPSAGGVMVTTGGEPSGSGPTTKSPAEVGVVESSGGTPVAGISTKRQEEAAVVENGGTSLSLGPPKKHPAEVPRVENGLANLSLGPPKKRPAEVSVVENGGASLSSGPPKERPADVQAVESAGPTSSAPRSMARPSGTLSSSFDPATSTSVQPLGLAPATSAPEPAPADPRVEIGQGLRTKGRNLGISIKGVGRRLASNG